jgi:hypothetical protein
VIDADALHRAAGRVGAGAGTPAMDALAGAGAQFLQESHLADEHGTPFVVRDPQALGYGIMLGYLAAREELEP